MQGNIFTRIYRFNNDAGLLDKPYDDFLESSFQVEEALEGFDMSRLADKLGIEPPFTPKYISRAIVNEAILSQSSITPNVITDVNRLDKACDAIVFAVGSMAKLGLTPDQMNDALHIVMDKNFAKLRMPKDEYGKLTKPADFVGPEPELQAILDSRG